MARLNDTSGIPNTCPKIDEVISFIDNLDFVEEYHTKKEIIDLMEDIRTANDGLRTHGHNLQNDLDYYEKLIKELEEKIEDLESDIYSYKNQIEELESNL